MGAVARTLILFLIVIIFVTIVVIVAVIRRNNAQLTTPTTINGFLASCATSPCAAGLFCDAASNYVCKKGPGAPCSLGSDCIANYSCSGVCVTGATGGFNQFCPCGPGLACTPVPGSASTCLVAAGNACSTNSDCSTNNCVSGFCQSFANGVACQQNSDCVNNNCSLNVCQAPGITTGANGSTCYNPNCSSVITNSSCDGGAECVCTVGAPTGVCATNFGSLNSTCTALTPCANELQCIDSVTGSFCTDTNACSCVFAYPDPNNNFDCPTGLIPVNGICLNCPFLGCSTNSQCAAGSCTLTTGNLVYYSVQTPTTIINVSDTAPTNIVRLFATSSGTVDTIYAVDSVQGVYMTTYDTVNIITTGWSLIIPSTPTFQITNAVFSTLAGVISPFFVVGITNGQTLLYTWNGTTLFPFSTAAGQTPGLQFLQDGTIANILDIDVSIYNDQSFNTYVLIVTPQTTTGIPYAISWLELTGATFGNFTYAVQAGGPFNGNPPFITTPIARYYYDTIETFFSTGSGTGCPAPVGGSANTCDASSNFSYISQPSPVVTPAIVFSGNIAGPAGLQPTDEYPFSLYTDQYEQGNNVEYAIYNYALFVPPNNPANEYSGTSPMASSVFLYFANTTNTISSTRVVLYTQGGLTSILPYQISSNSQPLVTVNGAYIYDVGTC